MTELHNMRALLEQRRLLRNNSTKYEKLLWEYIRNKLGMKFRRQASIGHYIVDFCCLRQKLVIEVDGKIHDTTESKMYDASRSEFLKQNGFRIIRFTNEQIEREITIVLNTIREKGSPSPY